MSRRARPLAVFAALASVAALGAVAGGRLAAGGDEEAARTPAGATPTPFGAPPGPLGDQSRSLDSPPLGTPPTSGFDPAAWRPPDASELPDGPLGASVRRGLALVRHTPDSLPAYAPGEIACTNCHLDDGRDPDAAPFTGVHARYPKYLPRSGAVVDLADRVNFCLTRSLAGRRLPHESREMEDILAYLAWLSRGVPVGEGHRVPGATGIPRIPGSEAMSAAPPGDSARGAAVYAARCASCHGADGAGRRFPPRAELGVLPPSGAVRVPALWGPRSYAIGASMARQERLAAFTWHHMPLGQGRSLTPAEAFDVAAFVNLHPRPDLPGKAADWPAGGAPADVPYATAGRAAYRPPARLLPRAQGAEATVPPPASVRRR